MKDSSQVKLSSLCTRIGDGLHGTPDYVLDGDMYFINGNNLKEGAIVIDRETKKISLEEFEANYIELNENSLLLSINGTLGNIAFYRGERIMLGKSAAYLNFKTDINKFYYYYFQLPSIQKYFYDVATGSTIKNLSLKSLQDFLVPRPKSHQYRKIAAVLSALDDKIELNNRINAELEQMAKTLYDYWFVQFDFPNKEGEPYKSSGGTMVYDEVLKREIPEGWERGGLAKLAIFNPTLSIKKNTISPYIEMASVPTSGYMTGEPQQKEFSGGVKFQNGDIVIARITPCLENGKTALITLLDEDSVGFGSTEFINIRARKKEYTSFLAITSRTYVFRNYAISKMIGTSGRKRVDAKEISTFQLAIPSEELLTKFASIVDVYFEKMTLNTKQNQQLASLRDWLLPMLMNGQVTFGEVLDHSQENSEEQVDTIGQEGTQMHLFA